MKTKGFKFMMIKWDDLVEDLGNMSEPHGLTNYDKLIYWGFTDKRGGIDLPM